MTKKYTTYDALNSINWQLKRIADSLEIIVEHQNPKVVSKNPKLSKDSIKLRQMLDGLDKNG